VTPHRSDLQPKPPHERTFWSLLPRRNFRRALFLIFALLAVVFIKYTGGFSLSRLFEDVAPAPAPAPGPSEFHRIEVKPPEVKR
jgi:hypothetical protein